jgi:hypothetical protein
VGIVAFEIRSEPSSPLQYSAYLEAQNFGQNPTDVAIKVAAADGREIIRNARLESGARFQEAFDLSSFAGGAVAASVQSSDDAFDLDDKAFAYIPRQRKTRALLVTKGNRYLEAALKLDAQVELHVTDPPSFAEADDIDAYVFDGFAPGAMPDRPALIIGAPAASWLPAIQGTATKPAITTINETHAMLRHVSIHDLSILQAAKIDAEGLTVIAGAKDTPLIVAHEVSGVPKWAMLTFSLGASDFPFQAGFPVFVGNTLAWFSREPFALRVAPGLARLPFKDATLETEDGKAVVSRTVLNETVFDAEQPGMYIATHDGVRQRVAVNLTSREFSNINDSTGPAAPAAASRRPPLQREMWFYMALAALALIVIEWFTYHRRVTL